MGPSWPARPGKQCALRTLMYTVLADARTRQRGVAYTAPNDSFARTGPRGRDIIASFRIASAPFFNGGGYEKTCRLLRWNAEHVHQEEAHERGPVRQRNRARAPMIANVGALTASCGVAPPMRFDNTCVRICGCISPPIVPTAAKVSLSFREHRR